MPKLSSGQLNMMEISKNSVNYEISGVTNETYETYIQGLIDKGYMLSSDGSYENGNYKMYTSITEDGFMKINLIVIND